MKKSISKLTLDTKINFSELTQTFIKSVRENQSQEALSADLQYNFNVVSRWEVGRRGFYWNDFIALAELKKWNVPAALNEVFHFKFIKNIEAFTIIDHLLIPSSKLILKNYFTVQKLNRLASGKSKLLFPDFLCIIEILYSVYKISPLQKERQLLR